MCYEDWPQKAAHSQIREIVVSLLAGLVEKLLEIFEDIVRDENVI